MGGAKIALGNQASESQGLGPVRSGCTNRPAGVVRQRGDSCLGNKYCRTIGHRLGFSQ